MTLRLRLLSAEDVRAALPMPEAIAAMKEAFAALAAGAVVAPQRGVLPLEDREGTVLTMAAFVPDGALTSKTVAIFQRNRRRGLPVVHGLLQVLDPDTGEPLALVDGGALTAWRTGAAGGAAAELLAVPEVEVAALIGAGVQAETQLLAMDCARPLREVRVCATRRDGAEAFARRLQASVRARLVPVEDWRAAVADADLVVAATNSKTPVLDGEHLRPGCHVTGVGSFTPAMRELDLATLRRARVFVDQRQAALAEAGDLQAGVRAGVTDPEAWTALGDVVRGAAPGRGGPHEITVFKSVGQAVQDAVAGARVWSAARRLGLGREVEL